MGSYPNPMPSAKPIMQRGAGDNQYGHFGMGMNSPGNTPKPGGVTPAWGGGNPYQVPGTGPLSYPWGTLDPTHAGGSGKPGPSANMGHGIIATGLEYPGLSQDMANFLIGQIGAGVSPFSLQTPLPDGGITQSGQLTASLNPLLKQLQSLFMGGNTSIPGMNAMSNIANNGISALPQWQSMIQAQQQNIQQQQANLREQFAGMGDLAGSPFGTAMGNFQAQTTADQNALLGQLTQQNILQGQIPMISQLFQGSQQFGSGMQALDQQAIQNQLQEFMRTQPQNNPMIQDIMGMATLFPPTTKTPTTWENINSTLGALSGSGFSTGGGSQGGGTSIQF